MGQEACEMERRAAIVRCSGSCDHTGRKYEYEGVETCEAAAVAPGGGQQACVYACLGFGSCAKACPTQCIHMENGVAVVDQSECIACGKCAAVCPKHLITIQEADRPYTVRCSSHDKGKNVKAVCDIGCIGCGICAKNCPTEAITMDNNLARIDQKKCINCGTCAVKCPVKIIY
jgi:Fe-S-cluster-containing hydrogenase component 2